MRRLRFGIVAALIGATVALAGCAAANQSNPTDAQTPAGVQTITNGQVVTGATTAPGAPGDAGAGETFFQKSCQSCHADGGATAGAGPKLAGLGRTADQIRSQIEKPVGVMPPGLATGQDLENVVAYVLGIQGGAAGGGATTGAATTAATTTSPSGGGGGDAAAIAAGKTFFEGGCQGCHSQGGNAAGVGPKLAGLGRTADQIKNQIEKPVGVMPPGLASGTDLENVVAYVLSLQ